MIKHIKHNQINIFNKIRHLLPHIHVAFTVHGATLSFTIRGKGKKKTNGNTTQIYAYLIALGNILNIPEPYLGRGRKNKTSYPHGDQHKK
jgi:hypothetical protein